MRRRTPWRRGDDADELYDLFTGGRALSENLQLDRELAIGADQEATVPVDSIQGVTVREFDWTEALAEIDVESIERDGLAARIPADQHAVFLPSLDAAARLLGELEAEGAPLLAAFELRAEHAATAQRYQRQLCLQLDEWTRRFGGGLVRSVAVTGSDPYLRTGSDLAVWIEAGSPEAATALRQVLEARQRAALGAIEGAVPVAHELGSHRAAGVASPDRAVSSLLVSFEDALLVSNSLPQLARVLAVVDGEAPALGDLPEYAFFRHRYARGDADETALVVISDATLRRWTGPRWRIAAARRTRAAAWLADLQARHLGRIAAGERGALVGDGAPGGLGRLELGPSGASSERYGSPPFLTPIAELELELVTPDEQAAYDRFRERYERSWSDWFDPIAARLTLTDERLALDLTVIPLILGTDYRELADFTGEARLEPRALDPHRGALFHLAMAVDPAAEGFDELRQLASSGMFGQFGPDPLGWLGDGVAVYADRDPFWDELGAAFRASESEGEAYIDEHLWSTPLAVELAVADPLRLAGFLAAARGFLDGAAPGLLHWETRSAPGLTGTDEGDPASGPAYVRVGPSAETVRRDEELTDAGLYYAALPDGLVLSLREDVLLRALARRAGGGSGGAAGGEDPFGPIEESWLGESAALRADRAVLEFVTSLAGDVLWRRGAELAWGHLPALNEWRRRFPDRDPLELHAELWHVRPVCPGGGEFVWDEEWGTFASTVFGHPGAPRRDAFESFRDSDRWPLAEFASGAFGLTFEHGGLRARAELRRRE